MKKLKDFGKFINETYLDASGNATQFQGGEKVKKYWYEDRRDTGKPGETSIGVVKRVETQGGVPKVLISYTDAKGQTSSEFIPIAEFDKYHEIVK